MDDAKVLLNSFQSWSVKHLKRTANETMHRLTKTAISQFLDHIWMEDFPSFKGGGRGSRGAKCPLSPPKNFPCPNRIFSFALVMPTLRNSPRANFSKSTLSHSSFHGPMIFFFFPVIVTVTEIYGRLKKSGG